MIKDIVYQMCIALSIVSPRAILGYTHTSIIPSIKFRRFIVPTDACEALKAAFGSGDCLACLS